MKLYWCEECGEFVAHIWATATIVEKVWFDVHAGQIEAGVLIATTDGFYPVPLDRLTNMTCSECEGPVQLREVAECPHDWIDMGTNRQCRLCLEWQRGRIVWD